MFRILLVDDEPMIKIGVRRLLDNTEYTVVGAANNGVDALTFLATNSVDIVMTDLKMPVMDGIELIHQLHALQFEGVILALSNYSDFELVRQALTEGASDYILKTDITRVRLLERLEKISRNMQSRQMKRIQQAQLALKQEQNAQKLLFAEVERALFTDYTLSADAQNFLAGDCRQKMQQGMLLIASAPSPTPHPKPLLRQLQSILPDIFSGTGAVQIIQTQQNQLLCLFFGIAGLELLQNRARQILRQAEIYFKAELVISLGVCGGGIQALRNCYEQCRNALQHVFYLPDSHLFPVDKFSAFCEESTSLYHDFLKEIATAFHSKSSDSIITEIRGFLSVCSQYFYAPDWVRSCCCRCSEHLLLSLPIPPDGETIATLMKQLKQAQDIRMLQRKMFDGLSQFTPPVSSLPASAKLEITAVLAFIDGRYAEKLTLEEIAEHVQLNKSYLCRLFKQEAGMSIFNYINQVRMKKAAQLLASKSSSHRVADVAAAVGIDDAFYFTRKFKEFFGKTPREYIKTTANTC